MDLVCVLDVVVKELNRVMAIYNTCPKCKSHNFRSIVAPQPNGINQCLDCGKIWNYKLKGYEQVLGDKK